MKKLFLTTFIMSVFLIGFSASNFFSKSIPGTYKIAGGYTMTIDKDKAVRLKSPNGNTYTGKATDGSLFDYHCDIDFTERVEINGFYQSHFEIDEDIQYIYEDYDYLEAKDERHRIKIEKINE